MMEEKCKQQIQHLCKKYESNSYILQRIDYHINTALETTLETEDKNYEKRIDRTNMLTYEQQVFMQVFLSKNNYYYLANMNCFYEYDGKHYTVIKEDDILHKLLTTITYDDPLIQWKYKTKSTIIKQIKERNLLKSIPESETIQNVLNFLYPAFFTTKDQVKYFLTVIGDNIFKKKQDYIYFFHGKSKKILTDIDNIAYISIGNTNATHNFMTKYHENHQYENCRLIHMVDNISQTIDIHMGLDLLCVAAHYSIRYENGDHYLLTKAGEDLKKYAFFLKNSINSSTIIDVFCAERITITQPPETVSSSATTTDQMKWKHMHYLWKQYLSQFLYPNMIYSNTLKQQLKERFQYHEESDSFLQVTSKFLPVISQFIQFWEENMVENATGELEMDEICLLFKTTGNSITETEVLKILKHFFPFVVIIEDKYVLNMACGKWDKWGDISLALQGLKEDFQKKEGSAILVSFDEAYTFYCERFVGKWIVNKQYFEKYININLAKFVVFDRFISNNWYASSPRK